MPGLLPHPDSDGLLEYSVVYTDCALNHMSHRFQAVMRALSDILKTTYHATSVALVPGSGSFGMEAVARQFATGQKCLVIRNGWFSYRWSQILEMGGIASGLRVLKARQVSGGHHAPFTPAPVDEVVAAIHAEAPAVVFAPHVETASGMVLPPDYLKAVADAAHAAPRRRLPWPLISPRRGHVPKPGSLLDVDGTVSRLERALRGLAR